MFVEGALVTEYVVLACLGEFDGGEEGAADLRVAVEIGETLSQEVVVCGVVLRPAAYPRAT